MKIRKLNEASEGFQKEFYNGYVILKNRAGDGWDIYSYEGTPEKVKRAVKEEEGLATLKDAKATIDSWVHKASLDEELSNEQKVIVDKIADRYSTSKPVSGNWDTEAQHEMKAIAKELNVSEDKAKSIMINYLGFDANKLGEGIDGETARASLNEGGYKITIEQDGKTFADYCYDYREESAIAQMKAKYGDNIEIKNIEAHNKVNESKATHCVYFTQDGMDQIEFEGSEDECNKYISDIQAEQDDEFGDEAPERFVKRLHEQMFTLNESLFREDFDDDKYTASRYLDMELPDICDKVLEMLDVLPSHKAAYITKICRDFYAKLESIISSYTMTNESLQEDVTDVVTDTLAGPVEGPESGLASLLNTAVQDEFKTIQMYNDIAVSARAEGFEDIATVVDEINTEENKHVGQLQELLKTVSPNAKAIDTGEIEGQQQIGEVTDIVEEDLNNSNSSPNNNIEEDGKDMKESWEEVYQSFKTIEKELNGDGEAITATIDQLYRDNKGNPDYEKAYKKWASGE